MAETLSKAERIADANYLLLQVSMFGRRFFYSQRHNRVARFELTIDGKLWLRDEHTDKRIYVAYKGRWRFFSNGGTLRRLVEALANYIRTGEPISSRHFGPWPEHFCEGDLWGYGKEAMETLRNSMRPCKCIAWPVPSPEEKQMGRRVETPANGIWPDFVAPQRFPDAAPEWEDPALPDFRLIWAAAREVGYSVGLHGSMKRDCDLIAAPWTDEAVGSADLVDHLCKALNARIVGGPENKPLGRVAVSLQIDGWFKVIDLSIAPRAEHPKPHDWFEFNGMTCCRSCGYVRNATSDTRSCKGPVKVELRPSPEGEANG